MIMKLIVKLNSLRRRSGGGSGGLGDDGDGSMLDGLLMGEREWILYIFVLGRILIHVVWNTIVIWRIIMLVVILF